MSDATILVEGLSKRYVLDHQESGGGLRHRLENAARAPFSWARRTLNGAGNERSGAASRTAPATREEFWALDDVSFKVKRGEILGIIGRNGAGKSTLLKILSRITEPTRGKIEIDGRVASLLEVGTGFHPELTGRENIFLNGAILGMGRAEIRRKFDEIVAFAEVERFLDTPVKRYSSGMYVRLAFAVAAHLEPEILIVDEVLAVGDVEFQRKCLGRMQDISRDGGRTVIFVSHNMSAVEHLCTSAMLLAGGRIQAQGGVGPIVAEFMRGMGSDAGKPLRERADRSGSGELRMVGFRLLDRNGRETGGVKSGDYVRFAIDFECAPGETVKNALISIKVKAPSGAPVFLQHNGLSGQDFGVLPERGTFYCEISELALPAAEYDVTLSVLPFMGQVYTYIDRIESAARVNVTEGNFFSTGETVPVTLGVCLVRANWSVGE